MRCTKNSFMVRHYLLQDFFYNPKHTKDLDEPIAALIRRITVTITTELRRWSDKECHDMLKQLGILMECTNAQKVTIDIVGSGDAAGMDWPTQETIRIIAPVVKDLIAKFKDCFSITKVLLQDKAGREARDITAYWSEPARVRPARTSFEELMKKQLQVWKNCRTLF
jgi:hypothetical protein